MFLKVDLSEKEVTEHGPLAYIKPIFYRSYDGDPESIAAYSAIYFSEDAFEEILKKDSTIKDEFSFLINDDLDPISASIHLYFQITWRSRLCNLTHQPADSSSW